MCAAVLAAGCSDDGDKTKCPGPEDGPLSTLTADVRLEQITFAQLKYDSDNDTQDIYELTLATGEEVAAQQGTGAFAVFKLAVEKDASPFGRYAIGAEGGDEQAVPGNKEGNSWYYALTDGSVTAKAPLCGGQLTLSKVPGKKPSDTYYYVSFSAADDTDTPHAVSGEYSGQMTVTEKPGDITPLTTYTLAGVSGYSQEEGYTTWGIDFDSSDFKKHLAIVSINAGPGVTEEEGIPAGVYTIAEDDAPFTVTWAMYDDAAQDISMQDLVEGTVTVKRDGDDYEVVIDGVDYDDAPFKADFKGMFNYENSSEERTFDAREVYAVHYDRQADGTSWYITLADRGYLETGDAVGNYYYGSILHLDLVPGGSAEFEEGLPEGTFQVLGSRSGIGIYGGTGSDCTSFLSEYFSGIPKVCKLTGGSVTIARKGEQATITFNDVEMSGEITLLKGSYTGKIQYIEGPEE